MSEEIVENAAPEAVESPEQAVETQAEESSEAAVELPSEQAVEVQAETEQELEEEIQSAVEDGASEEEVQEMIRQYTLKVDGKEIIKEIDLNNEDELKRQLQLALKGQKSTQELAELKKAYEHGLRNILSNPFQALKELDPNFDPLKLSADYIEQQYKAQQMSPEEKAEKERIDEYEKLKAEHEKLVKETQEREEAAARKALADEIQNDIMSALDSDGELVADRETVKLVAEELMWAARNDIEISAKEVLPTVKARLRQQFENHANRFKTSEILKKYMGESLTEKLREQRIQDAKKKVPSINDIKPTANSVSQEEEKPKKKISLSDFMNGR